MPTPTESDLKNVKGGGGAQSSGSGSSRPDDTGKKPGDGETGGKEGGEKKGSPDRYFVIDEATRVEGHEGEKR